MNQFSTFYINNQLYGIDVIQVQEIIKPQTITKIPLVPSFITGLINLRGQITTAINMKELLEIDKFEDQSDSNSAFMNVICKFDSNLISLLVDDIGDVLDLEENCFEQTPQTIPEHIKKFLSGVYKVDKKTLLSVIDLNKIFEHLNSHNP